MKLETIITGFPITLEQILESRTKRVQRQKAIFKKGGSCLISFTLNIAGEIKQFPLALAAFDEGLEEIKGRIPKGGLLTLEVYQEDTGSEAFFLLNAVPETIKKNMAALEEDHPLGRLFDIDVLSPDGVSISRSQLGLPARTCLVCKENAKVCARSQAHPMDLVLLRTAQLLSDYFI